MKLSITIRSAVVHPDLPETPSPAVIPSVRIRSYLQLLLIYIFLFQQYTTFYVSILRTSFFSNPVLLSFLQLNEHHPHPKRPETLANLTPVVPTHSAASHPMELRHVLALPGSSAVLPTADQNVFSIRIVRAIWRVSIRSVETHVLGLVDLALSAGSLPTSQIVCVPPDMKETRSDIAPSNRVRIKLSMSCFKSEMIL